MQLFSLVENLILQLSDVESERQNGSDESGLSWSLQYGRIFVHSLNGVLVR